MTKNYTNIVLNSLPERELEIIGQITAEKMSVMREKALKKIKENIELDGFRKGNAPDALIIQKVGEMRILEEASKIALNEEYPNILDEHKIDALGRPEITITKIGLGSPLEFKIKTALFPDVKLGDYKKIAKNIAEREMVVPEATLAEVDDVILNIRRNMAHQMMHAETGGEHTHDHAEIKDEDLPPLDDNFLKMIGDFKDLEDMKSKIRENIVAEKVAKENDKKRTDILEAIMADSKIEMPKIIVEGEQDKMLAQFKDDLAKSGIGFEDYLKHIKKTEVDLRNEWKETAVKRGKSQIILNTIAKEQNITPAEDEVKKEMENILAHYKDAERFRVRMYVETFMTNDLVFKWLEGVK